MNKKNSELIYMQRLRKYYLQCEIADLDEILLLSQKSFAYNHQNNHLGILDLDEQTKLSWSYISLRFWISIHREKKKDNELVFFLRGKFFGSWTTEYCKLSCLGVAHNSLSEKEENITPCGQWSSRFWLS